MTIEQRVTKIEKDLKKIKKDLGEAIYHLIKFIFIDSTLEELEESRGISSKCGDKGVYMGDLEDLLPDEGRFNHSINYFRELMERYPLPQKFDLNDDEGYENLEIFLDEAENPMDAIRESAKDLIETEPFITPEVLWEYFDISNKKSLSRRSKAIFDMLRPFAEIAHPCEKVLKEYRKMYEMYLSNHQQREKEKDRRREEKRQKISELEKELEKLYDDLENNESDFKQSRKGRHRY